MPVKSSDIYWLSGLLEGGGTFFIRPNGTSPMIKVAMKDKDVIKRVQFMLGGNYAFIESCVNNSPFYTYQIFGLLSVQWMMTLYSLVGERRRVRILEILNLWKGYISDRHRMSIGDRCFKGHLITEINSLIVKQFDTSYVKCKICSTGNTRPRDVAYKNRLLLLQQEEELLCP